MPKNVLHKLYWKVHRQRRPPPPFIVAPSVIGRGPLCQTIFDNFLFRVVLCFLWSANANVFLNSLSEISLSEFVEPYLSVLFSSLNENERTLFWNFGGSKVHQIRKNSPYNLLSTSFNCWSVVGNLIKSGNQTMICGSLFPERQVQAPFKQLMIFIGSFFISIFKYDHDRL